MTNEQKPTAIISVASLLPSVQISVFVTFASMLCEVELSNSPLRRDPSDCLPLRRFRILPIRVRGPRW